MSQNILNNFSPEETQKLASGHVDSALQNLSEVKGSIDDGTAPKRFINLMAEMSALSGIAQVKRIQEEMQFSVMMNFLQRMPNDWYLSAFGYSPRQGKMLVWLGVPSEFVEATRPVLLKAERETNKEFYNSGLSIDVELVPDGETDSIPFGFSTLKQSIPANVRQLAS